MLKRLSAYASSSSILTSVGEQGNLSVNQQVEQFKQLALLSLGVGLAPPCLVVSVC